MAGDLDITERVVWGQPAAATTATPTGEQATLGVQRLLADMSLEEQDERIIHRYGRMGIAVKKGSTTGGAPATTPPAPAAAPAPANLTEVERLGLAALRLRESAEYRAEKTNRSRNGETWDMSKCTTAMPAPTTARPPRAAGVPATPAPGPTSSYLEGSVAVGIIIVEGPTPDLKFSAAEAIKVVAEVQNGLSFYATQHPQTGITFAYDINVVTLTKNANPNLDPGLMEEFFRDPTMAALGFTANWTGVTNYVESIRTKFGTKWTYCAFFTKYPVFHFAYASIGGPRLVMQYANDGWGPDNIDRVFAHETGHIFGCPDEYTASNCTCDGAWGRFGIINGNCEKCAANGGVQCLMKGNTFSLCHYSRSHLGWAPRFIILNFGYNQGWRVNMHPRFVVDINNDKRADVVGFGNAGVSVSRAQVDGSYGPVQLVVANFGWNQSWRVEQHPRMLADTTGDHLLDIIGFGNAGVYVSRAQPNSTSYGPAQLVIPNFGWNQNWRVDQHPRFMADTNGDGRADVVGFGNAGVYVSRANVDGTFGPVQLLINNFGWNQSWRVDQHPRFVVDTNGDGRADIVGFGNAGVYISRAQPDGSYGPAQLVLSNFGWNQSWRVDQHPRFVVDITGDGKADIVGFGNAGVYVSLQQPNGTFAPAYLAVGNFGWGQGWRVNQHPRFLADTTGDGLPDIIGFGNVGVYWSRNLGGGKFEAPAIIIKDYGLIAGGWAVDKHPRVMADTNGDGRADIFGFGDAGTLLSRL